MLSVNGLTLVLLLLGLRRVNTVESEMSTAMAMGTNDVAAAAAAGASMELRLLLRVTGLLLLLLLLLLRRFVALLDGDGDDEGIDRGLATART
jgi:hypothetical protein